METSDRKHATAASARLALACLVGLLALGGSAARAAAGPTASGGRATPSPITAQRSRAELYQSLLDFHGKDLQGRVWDHERLRGRIVLVDFWATWCVPCREELPFIKRARARYGDDFEVLGISLDTRDRASLVAWLQRQGVDWPQIQQRRGFDDRIPVDFGVYRLPANLLLDRQGRLRALDVRGERLFREIDALLAEERGTS